MPNATGTAPGNAHLRLLRRQASYEQTGQDQYQDGRSVSNIKSNDTIVAGEWAGNVIGVFTSGGDAQ
ncbi:hypothetical protein ElyMa_006248600, partial [Elysia marginata]